MNTLRKNRTIPLSLAVLLMAIIVIIAGLVVTVQYNQQKKLIAASEKLNDSQQSQVMATFARIESNLAKIREKESMIRQDFQSSDNYSNLGPEERIQHEIEYIQYLIDENNQLIAGLNQQVAEKDEKLKEYRGTLKDLQSRISRYQEDVNLLMAEKVALQHNLDEATVANNKLSGRIEDMNNEIIQKSNELTDQKLMVIQKDNDLNKAYYAIGPYKELRDKEILQKEGGFLGINRVTTLTANPDLSLFNEIDIREVSKIPVFAKSWEIVTGQDPSSYEREYVNENLEWIKITDREKFWKKSNYLVIVIREKNPDELAFSR